MDQQNKHALIDKMERIDLILDEYESNIGLSTYHEEFLNSNTAYAYMNMSRDQIEKMDIHGCAEAAYILGSLSFHIQRSINRETARLNWAKATIKEIICKSAGQYTGTWGNQDMQATLDNDASRKLHEIQKYCQQRIDRLTYLATSIKNMSDLFINLQRAKVASNG
jgi:hypothetical protein